MTRLNYAARRFFAFGAGGCMMLVFGIIFLNSLRRYTMGRSVPWGEELPIYLTIYGVMFGIALAYMQDQHIRFTVLTDTLSAKVKTRLFAAVDFVMIGCGLALARSGHEFATKRGNIDASGLKSVAKSLAESTGFDWMIWIGKVGTWQYAMVLGGVMLAVAAALKLHERLAAAKGTSA
ncbi:TRAP transporter small permease subunit [Thalassobius vesicularis]|uniref:TRAP transporter small permease protein n=1 Tax=Thalassobius vesicularis TaxID=1294297 RepID=A0A4S3MGD1_9RHOB|nr:TRAP transporter small permease subunit [Thalassobius vesicularis]THD76804.1 TRAP transporter small permease subunit [Thalassobius vesicularis]